MTMTPEARQQYIASLEAEIEQARKNLEPLESGRIHLQSKSGMEPWRDVTQSAIDHNRSIIATLEAIVVAFKRGETP